MKRFMRDSYIECPLLLARALKVPRSQLSSPSMGLGWYGARKWYRVLEELRSYYLRLGGL